MGRLLGFFPLVPLVVDRACTRGTLFCTEVFDKIININNLRTFCPETTGVGVPFTYPLVSELGRNRTPVLNLWQNTGLRM